MSLFSLFPRRFLRDDRGAVTVEFVVIFPVLIGVLVLITFISLLISSLSDVQQITHDLARVGLRHAAETSASGLCGKLRATELPALLSNGGYTLVASDLALHCTLTPDPLTHNVRILRVDVSYNFAGKGLADLGQSIGWPIGTVTRSAAMAL